MKFKFSIPDFDAASPEDALNKIVQHLTTVTRNFSSGRSLEECGALFTLAESSAKTDPVDLTKDAAVSTLGPIELELDPDSPQARKVAERKVADEAAAAAETARLARGNLTDDDIIAQLKIDATAEHEASLIENADVHAAAEAALKAGE